MTRTVQEQQQQQQQQQHQPQATRSRGTIRESNEEKARGNFVWIAIDIRERLLELVCSSLTITTITEPRKLYLSLEFFFITNYVLTVKL
ncbi:hypothetical protein M0802_003887 [Mischocyttarus mexicanus]|nr:hypothetical protein M0802_016500 [Mischocyttarus mexicanus]KAI4472794.1 hypothetical protein M0802_016501 [Mischocyttarus mexicanus]KAI4501084.1 hypothetical protein M0802_003887 [Mischocyttarus mexicanus]